MNELEDVRKYIIETTDGNKIGEKIANNAINLIKNRMRIEDTYCYLYRMLKSLSKQQISNPTEDVIKKVIIDFNKEDKNSILSNVNKYLNKFLPIDLESIEKKSKFENV